MLKCSSERCVCAPHSLSAGTSTTPILSVSLRTSVISAALPHLLPRIDLRHGNIEAVQGDGYHAIQPDEVDELCGSLLAECRYRLSIGQLRQDAARDEGCSNIISHPFLTRQVARALAGNDRRDLVVRQAAKLRDKNMRVDLVGRAELRAGYEDRYFPNWPRQFGRRRQCLDQLPNRRAEFRESEPRVPWTNQ